MVPVFTRSTGIFINILPRVFRIPLFENFFRPGNIYLYISLVKTGMAVILPLERRALRFGALSRPQPRVTLLVMRGILGPVSLCAVNLYCAQGLFSTSIFARAQARVI